MAYVALAALGAEVAVLERLPVWYPPAGLAMAAAAIWGWRTYPALAIGEVVVGMTLFGVADDLGWLVVPGGLAYAAVLTIGGRAVAGLGGTAPDVAWRRTLPIVAAGAITTPLAAAAVGVGFRWLAGLVEPGEVAATIVVWALGDAVGIASTGITVVTVVVRWRRGGRWWALPDVPTPLSSLLVATPALLVGALSLAFEGTVPFIALALVPHVVLCAQWGVPAAGLASPLTSVAVTAVAVSTYGDDVIAVTDLQVLLLLVLVLGGVAGLAVEERRELVQRLGERERHLRRAEVQARSGSFRWDVRGRTIQWSDGLLRLLGLDGQPSDDPVETLDVVHPEDRATLRARFEQAAREGGGFEMTSRLVARDGTVLDVRVVLTTRRFDGRIVEAVGTVTDVTTEASAARRLAEALARERDAAERQRLARDESSRAAALQARTERIRESLLVAVSHEIRTPLTVIRGLVETLRRPGALVELEASTLFASLDRNTQRLERALTDLLDVDRIRRGVIEPRRAPVAVEPLITTVVDRVGIDPALVRVDVDEGVRVFPLDPRITERIVEHLLLNAKRHAPGVPVAVHASARDDRLELRVEDEGPGLPTTDPVELLDAFRSGGRDPANPGTGVGLYLVDQFTALHGGTVTLDTRDGGGTSVIVALPNDGTTVIELPDT